LNIYLSTKFEENMFYLQVWAQLKNTIVSGAQSFEYFDLGPHPEKMIGLKFEYFHLV
jgi:hypothetical protein